MNFLLERLHRSQYAIVSEDDSDRNENDREVAVPALRCNHSRSRLAFLTTSTILVMIAGVGGFLIGVAMSLDFRGSYMPVGTVPQGQSRLFSRTCHSDSSVPIGRLSKNFQYNETFAAVPSTTVTREPVWDSLLPSKSKI